MLALQEFYSIKAGCAKSPCNENQLFVEIARTFGLTFWLEDGIGALSEHNHWSEKGQAYHGG